MNLLLKVFWNLVFRSTGLDISFDAKYYDWSFYLIELKENYQGMKKMLQKVISYQRNLPLARQDCKL